LECAQNQFLLIDEIDEAGIALHKFRYREPLLQNFLQTHFPEP